MALETDRNGRTGRMVRANQQRLREERESLARAFREREAMRAKGQPVPPRDAKAGEREPC